MLEARAVDVRLQLAQPPWAAQGRTMAVATGFVLDTLSSRELNFSDLRTS